MFYLQFRPTHFFYSFYFDSHSVLVLMQPTLAVPAGQTIDKMQVFGTPMLVSFMKTGNSVHPSKFICLEKAKDQ